MAKKEVATPAVTFVGEGEERVMLREYFAIGKVVRVPVGALSSYNDGSDLTNDALDHGWKQRSGDFRAVDGDLPEREKDTIACTRLEDYLEHLQAGGDWKMSNGNIGLTGDLVKAVSKITGLTEEQVRAGAKAIPEQVKSWRKDLGVKNEVAKLQAAKAAKAAKDAKSTLEVKGLE